MPVITFSGLASGIDSDAIIEAISDQSRLQSIVQQNKIEGNTAETSALEEYNSKLLGLRDSLEGFLTLGGGALSKTVTSSNSDAVTASANNDATNISTQISVTSLAKGATFSFNDRFTDPNVPLAPGLTGTETIAINVGSGAEQQTISVDITATTTLAELSAEITNAGEGFVQSSVLNLGTAANPQYTLLMNSSQSGLEKGTLSVQVPPAISALGLFGSNTIDQAQDAVFTVSGIGQVTRGSNEVADVMPGVTLSLKQTGPALISVVDDSARTAEKLQTVIDQFNDLVKYSAENSTVERVEEGDSIQNIFGTLSDTRLDERIITSLRGALAGSNSDIAGSEIRIFADLGVTTQRDGTLGFDQDKFSEAVGKNPSAVSDILNNFADKTAATNGVISSYTKFQGLIDVAKRSNDQENESLQDTIDRIEASIESQAQNLRMVFARLESSVARANSQSSSLNSLFNPFQNR